MAEPGKIYAGKCVGGPMAGKHWSHAKDHFVVEVLGANSLDDKPVRFAYIYLMVGKDAYWAIENWSKAQVQSELLRGYHAEADTCVCGKPNKV